MLKDFSIERKTNQGYTIVSVLFNRKMVIIYIAKRCNIHGRTFFKGLQDNSKDLKISSRLSFFACTCHYQLMVNHEHDKGVQISFLKGLEPFGACCFKSLVVFLM